MLPLLAALPFMYAPKVLEGDTQPWVLMGALFALFSFRTRRFVRPDDGILIGLASLSFLAYAARSELGLETIRNAYTQITFIVLWVVSRRERGDFFPAAIRLTIVVWLGVGLYQYFSIAFGLPIEISGRYVEGRSGVPSLTSEPSTYGSLSMIHMMYLLSERKARNNLFIAAAAASVVLSGSLLALVLLVFPLMKLKMRWRVAAALGLALLVVGDGMFTDAGLTARLSSIAADGSGLAASLLDPSLNLRFGHVYFTLFENLSSSLWLTSPVDFMEQYNRFAADSGVFIETGSNFILSAAGELIYGSGIAGALLLFFVIRKARAESSTPGRKLEKTAFIIACMLNPISLSNAFLIIYAQQKD